MTPLTDEQRDRVTANSALVGVAKKRYARNQYILLRRLGVPDDDIEQELQLALIVAVAYHDGRSKLGYFYLTSVVRRRLDALIRRTRAGRVLPLHDVDRATEGDTGAVDAADETVSLRAALARLPAVQREAIQLRYLDGLSRPETARRMGVCGATIRTRIKAGFSELLAAGVSS